MIEAIDQAIKKMSDMTRANSQPEAALKFSQATLNLAHAKRILKELEISTKGA